MGKGEFAKHIGSDPLPIHAVSERDLLTTIACNGFRNEFYLNSIRRTQSRIVNNEGAYGLDQTATIMSKDGQMYRLHHITDRDNRGILLTDLSNRQVVSKVILRDRHNDGTLEATPPQYLKSINHVDEQHIPERSREIGFTTWSYSNPGDVQEPGIRSVELSIVSSDPQQALLDRLLKKNRLFVNPRELAAFIDNPFAYIPFEDVNEKTINLWWKYWFQVVDRGMRGKAIPQPGQTSQRGFEGFFSNTLEATEKIAKSSGYTHLTAVPTWTYVWHAFIERGFTPVDAGQARETTAFLERIASITLPNGDTLSTLSPKHPLASWLAVAPFVLQLNTEFVPHLGIDEVREERFRYIFEQIKNAVQSDEGVKTYPLAPGKNLWLSKKL